jgi:MFS family permease
MLVSFLFLFFVTDNKNIYKTETKLTNINDKKKMKMFAIIIFLICIPVTLKEITSWSFYEITPFWVNSGFSSGIAISILQMMQFMPGLLVQPVTGKLCDILKPVRMVVLSFFLFSIGFILFAFQGLGFVWPAMILFGIGMAASTVASETYMASLVSNRNRALLYGIVLSVGLGLGGKLGGFSGKVVDIFGKNNAAGYNVWFISMGILAIISTGIYYFIEKLRNSKI